MKKTLLISASLIATISCLTACGSQTNELDAQPAPHEQPESAESIEASSQDLVSSPDAAKHHLRTSTIQLNIRSSQVRKMLVLKITVKKFNINR